MTQVAKRKRTRKRAFTVTCRCSAYDFPHRVEGGKCSGSEWAEAYAMIKSDCCEQCNCNSHLSNGFSCDVIEGKESVARCEGFQDFRHSCNNAPIFVPVELYLEKQYGSDSYYADY